MFWKRNKSEPHSEKRESGANEATETSVHGRVVDRTMSDQWRRHLPEMAELVVPLKDHTLSQDQIVKLVAEMSDEHVGWLLGCLHRRTKDFIPGVDGPGGISPDAKRYILTNVSLSDK